MSGPGFYDELWTVVEGAVDQEWVVTTPAEYDAVVASVTFECGYFPERGVAGSSVQLFRVSHGHDPLTAEDVDQGAECVCAQYEQSHLPIREWMAS